MLRPFRHAAGILCALAVAACVPPPSQAPRLSLRPVGFDALPGWRADRLSEALAAFRADCAGLAVLAPEQKLGGEGEAAVLGGQAGQWRGVCAAAALVPPGDDQAARDFLERHFQAYAVGNDGDAKALFTGYYEPQVNGSAVADGNFQTPLLARPDDLVQVDLSEFFADLKGRRTAGRVIEGRLVPYFDRAEIEQGALGGRRLALAWLADPIDLFFLQIQGSGRVRLPDGRIFRVAYAAQNGRPYVPIGKLLIERHALAPAQVSAQSIRAWLVAHPSEAPALMDANPSYVFFRELPDLPADLGPPGALGVSLTAGRSLAVDQNFLPLGAPVWVDTTDPVKKAPLRRLMLAEDLGGAIRGPVRADIFFGWGPAAEDVAGRMNQPGREYVLLPLAAPRPAAKAKPAR